MLILVLLLFLQTEASLSSILNLLKLVNPKLDVSKLHKLWKTSMVVGSSLPKDKCKPVHLLDEKSSHQQVSYGTSLVHFHSI